jgi:lysophospholipase L1-like esterase
MRWRRYVAIGDSFTEGMNDIGSDGNFRGWADLVASRLAAEYRALRSGRPKPGEAFLPGSTPQASLDAHFRYANLAIRGRLFDRIVDEQVPEALRMRPDLVSFAGGGNDVLRRNFDPAAMLARFDDVVRRLRDNGADVIIFRWANITGRLPGRRMILPRMQVLNQAVGEVAQRHGALLVDLWHDEAFHNPELWSEDRLHMATIGHLRVAGHVLRALGVEPDPTWFDPPGPPRRRTWPAARAHDVRWARQHLVPWMKRRITGRSSGDTVTAKRPALAPFTD